MAKVNYEISQPNILKYYGNGTWNAIAVMVDDTNVTANADGLKIVPAGTIVGGTANPVLTNRNEPVSVKDDSTAEGVLLYSVDVTNGPVTTAMVVEGYVDLTKLPTAPTAAVIDALSKITFMN